VFVGVRVFVGVGGGGGHSPSTQKSPIVTITMGSSTEGSLPQKLNDVSGGTIVSILLP
jgi:hypothetical protein